LKEKYGQAERPIAFFVWVDSKVGGAERRFFRLFGHLQENDYDVHLFTSAEGVGALQSLGLAVASERVHVLASARPSAGRISRYLTLIKRNLELVSRVRRFRIRHLHFAGVPGTDTLFYSAVKKFACSFSVSMVNSTKVYQRSIRNKFYTIVTAKFCTYIDCLSEQIRDDLCSFLGRKYAHKCLVSPCSFTDIRAVKPASCRDIDIVMIARMIPLKGHDLLKDSLLELERQNRLRIVVHVCGSGPIEAEVRRSFEAIEGQQVHIHYEEDPFAILARSKVFVSLQDLENYPSQSLLEAMICECAVVATDVGLTRQLLDESCSILVARNPVALASALRKLLDSKALRDSLGANAAKKVASTQTIERFAEYFLVDLFGIEIAHLEHH
jgi:glycosyltransferase involved in cell wall biosynthesis